MKTVTLTEAEHDLANLLKRAESGEEVAITNAGKLFVVSLLPVKPGASPSVEKRRLALAGHPAFGLWKQRNVDGVEYQRKLREEWER